MRKPSSSSYSSPPDASKPDLACRPHARRLHESPQIKCMSADDGYSHLGGHTGSKEAEGIKEKDENGAERRPKNAPADVHRKTASGLEPVFWWVGLSRGRILYYSERDSFPNKVLFKTGVISRVHLHCSHHP